MTEPISRRHRLRSWAPAVLWAALIFFASSGGFSGAETLGILETIARLFLPAIPLETIEFYNAILRKLAHVLEYFVFVLLIDRGFRDASSAPRVATPLYAFGIAVLYSLSDEAHQAFVPNRTASLLDCGIDSLGAGFAALIRFWR